MWQSHNDYISVHFINTDGCILPCKYVDMGKGSAGAKHPLYKKPSQGLESVQCS